MPYTFTQGVHSNATSQHCGRLWQTFFTFFAPRAAQGDSDEEEALLMQGTMGGCTGVAEAGPSEEGAPQGPPYTQVRWACGPCMGA